MIRQLSLLTQMRMYFISKDRKGVSQSLLSMSFLNTENYILKIIIGMVDPITFDEVFYSTYMYLVEMTSLDPVHGLKYQTYNICRLIGTFRDALDEIPAVLL